MRILTPLVVVCIVLMAMVPAEAETYREDGLPTFAPEPQIPLPDGQGHAILRLSPMYLEIFRINEAVVATEAQLLADLAAAADDGEVDRLVRRLERLDVDRQLAVLKVRIRYARLEGKFDEAFRLRQDMLQLLERDSAPPM